MVHKIWSTNFILTHMTRYRHVSGHVIVLALHLIISSSICHAIDPVMPSTAPVTEPPRGWIIPALQQPARGVVLIAHGLNTRIESHQDVVDLLTKERGQDVVQIILRGHIPGAHEEVSPEVWRDDINRGMAMAWQRANGRPIVYIGHSLSGAAVIKAIRDGAPLKPAKMLLLAPALAIRLKALPLRLAVALDFFGLTVPSWSADGYRLHDWIPLAYYDALFELVGQNSADSGDEALAAVDTTVLLSPLDSLVHSRRVERWVKEHNLPWRVRQIRPDGALASRTLYHALLDRAALGSAWDELIEELPS